MEDGARALERLREISDQVVELTRNLPFFPTNRSVIDDLERERKEITARYIREAPPYP